MSAHSSVARWRDEPVVPNTSDVASLVKLARKARGRLVEFEWSFGHDDLRSVRRAVYEWGTPIVGRYKVFDARVLNAINLALGEPDSHLALKEPKVGRATDCTVTCVRHGDVFRLHGHGPFDCVIGYGIAASERRWKSWLGPKAADTLLSSVSTLGWDTRVFQEDRFRPVRNVLFGFPVGHKVKGAKPVAGPPLEVAVTFRGPYSAAGEPDCSCLFDDDISKRKGVYLWTINVGGQDRVWYVGQTARSFAARTAEHIAGYLSGQYRAYDAEALAKGQHVAVKGTPSEGNWPGTIPGFLRNLPTVMPAITALVRSIRFHFAPLDGDEHLLNRVEGAIGRHFKNHPDSDLQKFLIPGLTLPSAIPYDRAIRLVLSSDVPIAGLPSEIRE